uniref:Spermatogenesis-associated protein 1 C-terminal domain-containing protein n=1 Tax=Acanthochromis polyacanthus TaxID=80966 RepID=A0A3Q1FSK4_9TELE
MERSSCESVRCSEDRRPSSCKLVELHVLYVPAHQWNLKLNKVPAEAAESFISAGFIRVHPDVSLRTLRRDLGALLGADGSIDRFSFLKCVGRSLALVRSKQERELKVKTFAPPYAVQPELYLLSTLEADSSSQSFSPDTSSSSPEPHIYYQPPGAAKEPVKLPHISQCSQQAPPTPQPEEEDEEEEQIYSSSEGEGEDEEEVLSSMRRPVKLQIQRPPQPLPLNKVFADLQRCEVDPAQTKQLPDREETFMKKKPRGSRAAESLEDSGDSGFSLTDGDGKSNTLKSIRNKPTAGVKYKRILHKIYLFYLVKTFICCFLTRCHS